jgi:plasmid stabilization system protein ParE
MEKKISWTLQARSNIKGIINYLETEWSNRIAESFYDETSDRLQLIIAYPDIGIQSLTRPAWRKILITKHNILVYRIDSDIITVLNIIDTRSSAYTI